MLRNHEEASSFRSFPFLNNIIRSVFYAVVIRNLLNFCSLHLYTNGNAKRGVVKVVSVLLEGFLWFGATGLFCLFMLCICATLGFAGQEFGG